MSSLVWQEEAITRDHPRKDFDCGNPCLNAFLHLYARQSHDQGGAKTFLAVEKTQARSILGFYSLSPACLTYARTPALLRQGLGRYDVPAFRLARLAVARDRQKQGLGGQLLIAAGRRCLRASAEVGGVMLILEAKSQESVSWYESYGALSLQDDPLTLVFPLTTFKTALREKS